MTNSAVCRSVYFILFLCFSTVVLPGTRAKAWQSVAFEQNSYNLLVAADEGELLNATSDSSKYPNPNTIPYHSKKSPLAHLFSLPAKIWHLVWTPLGVTVIWIEQNKIPQKLANFLFPKDRDPLINIIPRIRVGGSTGFAAGVLAYIGESSGRKMSAHFLFSSLRNHSVDVGYQNPSLFGSSFYFDLTGNYLKDSKENFYIRSSVKPVGDFVSSIGSDPSLTAQKSSYATEEFGALANFGYTFSNKIGLGIVSHFRRVNIGLGNDEDGEFFPVNTPGFGSAKLFSVGGSFAFNNKRGWPRVLSGPSLRISYTYNKEVEGNRFEYNRITVEMSQHFSLPIFARNRRLAVRGLFEKNARIGDKQIPVYDLSFLGHANDLRGFDRHRFNGRGRLLFNFEYHYPVWDWWDAVLFVDQGQVYDDFSEIKLGNFRTAIGAGLRFMSSQGFLIRFEVARSTEQWRALLRLSPNF